MRKPLRRSGVRRETELVTTNQIMAWLEARFATDPQLRQSIKRVLAAIRKEQTPAGRRRRA